MTGLLHDTSFDSWLTIGLTNGDPQGEISSIGIDFTKWDESTSLEVDNGAVFLMDPSKSDLTDQGNEIVIAQITIPTHSSPTIVVNVQGKTIDFTNNVADRSWTEKNIYAFQSYHQYTMPPILFRRIVFLGLTDVICAANNGVLGGCTRMMCFRQDTPHCLQYSNVIAGH